MTETRRDTPVNAKAVLIDPVSMTALWMNESAAHDLADQAIESVDGMPVERAVPMAEILGVPEALRTAAETGVAQHVRADLVSTSKGSVAIVASVYPLPGGAMLLIIENAWQLKAAAPAAGHATKAARRRRRIADD